MVRHTYQDFLHCTGDEDVTVPVVPRLGQIPLLSSIRDASQEKDLFDIEGYVRKMQLSYLDEHIEDRQDWEALVKPLQGVGCLYLIDDRLVHNPIMEDYARVKNQQYIRQFARDGIRAVIVRQ